jgi:hypothetical protein
MTLEEGLRAALIADSAVNAVVSGRIYHERMPDPDSYPAIVFFRVSTSLEQTLTDTPTLSTVRIQLDLMAETSAAVRDLATKVRAVLHNVQGDLGGVTVGRGLLENELDTGFFDGDERRRRIAADYMFMLHE